MSAGRYTDEFRDYGGHTPLVKCHECDAVIRADGISAHDDEHDGERASAFGTWASDPQGGGA